MRFNSQLCRPVFGFSGPRLVVAGLSLAAAVSCLGAEEWRELVEQNRRLQEQVRAQQQTIEALSARITDVVKTSERHERELRGFADRADPAPVAVRPAGGDRGVRIAGEAGIAFFNTGPEGQFPKGEFRADDPVVSIEAPVMKNTYVFAELKLLPRETNAENFQLGEFYVDFENVSAAWGAPGLLNVRAGRLNIPFGEEYLVRGPSANPLVSHSLADIWGVDEGVEIYGRVGPASYVLAVQNGGVSRLRDFNADKAITGRVSWEPAKWLHLSGSAMRTGELANSADSLSEVWIGNGFFRALPPPNRAGAFWATLAQLDAKAHWKGGHLGLALGRARYADSDRTTDNSRRIRFGHVEAVQDIFGGLYGALRYSEMRAGRGYPLAGWGTMGAYFFRPVLTTELRRTTIGLGYRFAPPLVLKVEYTHETGTTTTGGKRDKEDFFGTEIGVKF